MRSGSSFGEQFLRAQRGKLLDSRGFCVWHAVCVRIDADAQLRSPPADRLQQNCKRNTNVIMKLNRRLILAGAAALLCLGVTQSGLAQDNPPGGGGRQGRGNFDPAQFRERMMERMKERLEVTDDTEWKALEPLVQNVMDARRATMSGMGRGMFGGGRRGGGGGDNNGGGNGDQQRRNPFGQPSPEADALQKAIDAKAPKAEVKAALDKYMAYRKAKQAELEKAQDDLRKVLTSRQEAIATLDGIL
jgi:hypothetical protein